MKLNHVMFAFGVGSKKFLGFMVSEQLIDANLEKVEAIPNMPSLWSINEVQNLTCRVADLFLFVSTSIDKCLPFFKVMWKAQTWDGECNQEFNALKKYLTSPLLLSQPRCREVLVFYLSVCL